MNEINLLLKFLNKANKEISENPSDEKVIFMKYITSLIGTVTGDAEKRLVKLAKKKRPLQYLLDLYTLHKTDYINQADEIVTNSCESMNPYSQPFFCNINDTYSFYLDGHPIFVDKQHCYVNVYHSQSNKTIYDFICSYEQYQSGYYLDDVAIGVFILNYYLEENCYERTHEN